ncbi:MAG TPA: lysozyme inhibitor LprI family protein [Chthoniobacterales bacterium]|nr:lysozyme inhibitor LprI family protein [Chthoniobacterales bacterium]
MSVQKKLEKGFYKVLHKHEPTFKEVDVRFSGAALVKPQFLVVHASGTIPKERDTAEYVLKFKISGEAEQVRFELESARRLPEESQSEYDSDTEAALNAVYNRVRKKLSATEREALREEQTKWLELRANMADESSQNRFTEHRVAELRAMTE